MRLLFALTLMAFLFSACPKVPSQSQPQPTGYQLGESIMISMDETISIPAQNLKIRLTDVKDGRCPKGTNCLQAGEAKVMLEVIEYDAVDEINLEAKGFCTKEDGSCGNSAKSFGRLVQLLFV